MRTLAAGSRSGIGTLVRLDLAERLYVPAPADEQLLLHLAAVRVVVGGGALLGAETALPGEQLVEVDPVGVEVGSVDACEAGLAVDGDPARAAHAGAVDHDRVERHHRRHAEGR